jgi:hypothetical protein
MAGAVLEGILVDEPIEVVRQLAGHFGWATGAGAIPWGVLTFGLGGLD